MAKALAVVEKDGVFFLHEARGGVAVGEPVAGPFPDRGEAETARFCAMKSKVKKSQGYRPLRHASPAHARSRVA